MHCHPVLEPRNRTVALNSAQGRGDAATIASLTPAYVDSVMDYTKRFASKVCEAVGPEFAAVLLLCRV